MHRSEVPEFYWPPCLLQVIRLVHGLLSRLMSIFPTEPTSSSVASKYEELDCLYACVGKVRLHHVSAVLRLVVSHMRMELDHLTRF
jgi:transformation/transcription domain-associated protein